MRSVVNIEEVLSETFLALVAFALMYVAVIFGRSIANGSSTRFQAVSRGLVGVIVVLVLVSTKGEDPHLPSLTTRLAVTLALGIPLVGAAFSGPLESGPTRISE